MVKVRKGFTLIELLVVISIIALLLSVLVPTLGKAKAAAKGAVCKSNLHQWGLMWTLYFNEHEGRIPTGRYGNYNLGSAFAQKYGPPGSGMWMLYMNPYFVDANMSFCPAATKPYDDGGHQPFQAWNPTPELDEHWIHQTKFNKGSYGMNGMIGSFMYGDNPYYVERRVARIQNISAPAQVPIFGDSAFLQSFPSADDLPPETEDDMSGRNLRDFCVNRHNKHTQLTLIDGHVEKVGLKRLWRLKWHKKWSQDLADAGGEPDWPDWMSGMD